MKRSTWVSLLGFTLGVLGPLVPCLGGVLPPCPPSGHCLNMCVMPKTKPGWIAECQECCEQMGLGENRACLLACDGQVYPCVCPP